MEPEVAVAEEETAETYVKAGTNWKDADGNKGRIEAGVSFNPGEDLTTAVELYGEEVVYQRYLRGVTKDLGNAIRSGLNKHVQAAQGEDGEGEVDEAVISSTVSEELKDWRPDVSRRPVRKDAGADILSNFALLSPEKQAEIISELQAKAAAL